MELTQVIDLLPLGLFALCLWGMGFAKPFFSELREDYLSSDSTTALRGLLALVVVMSHLAQQSGTGVIFPLIGRTGYMAVAVFFFLSGYGLQKQHMLRDHYAKGFLWKRLRTVAVPCLVVLGLFWACHAAMGRVYSLTELLTQSIMPYTWYVTAVLVFYVVFWLLMLLCKRNYAAMLLGGLVWFVAYMAVCISRGQGIWWYISTLPVVIGMVWAVYEQPIRTVLQRFYFLVTGLVLMVLAATLVWSGHMEENSAMDVAAKIVASATFSVLVVLLLYKVRLGNPVLRWLGQISMEIYLLQGLAIWLLRSTWVHIENDLLYAIAVLLMSIAVAAVVHIALKGIPNQKRRGK